MPLERASLRGWVTELLDGPNQPATARARQHAVRRFTAGSRRASCPPTPFLGITAPKLDTAVVEPLTDDHL